VGVSNYDKGAATKKYENKYTLSTVKGIKSLLKDINTLNSRAYERGDMAAIDLIVDLRSAIGIAGLTERQITSINQYYFRDQDQETTAKFMGCDISTESRHRKAALERIKNVFQQWEYN
jgi:DNA-directed RNA polymerase specialized sigma24 family protein